MFLILKSRLLKIFIKSKNYIKTKYLKLNLGGISLQHATLFFHFIFYFFLYLFRRNFSSLLSLSDENKGLCNASLLLLNTTIDCRYEIV